MTALITSCFCKDTISSASSAPLQHGRRPAPGGAARRDRARVQLQDWDEVTDTERLAATSAVRIRIRIGSPNTPAAAEAAAQGPAVPGHDAQLLRPDPVPPFAVRARPGATVPTPLAWEEVEDRSLAPSRFTIATVLDHVERASDPWKDLPRRGRSLGRARWRLDALVEQGASGQPPWSWGSRVAPPRATLTHR